MSADRFSYGGPATIDGVSYPSVLLMEEPPESGLRSWSGSASFEVPPTGFSDTFGGRAVDIQLPDGRRGRVLVDNVFFDGASWTVSLQGTGPAPE